MRASGTEPQEGGVEGGGMEWIATDRIVPLEADEVQVWRVRVGEQASLREQSLALLAAGERERMARFRVELPREEFVLGRGLLRMLAGAALGRTPESLVFGVGAQGKPWLEGIEFSVSHSRGMVLVALCRSAAVGVDVERIDPGIDALEVANSSFAAEESAWIARAAEGTERVQAFYDCWTCKEAVLKAHGGGLTLSLAEFFVAPCEPGERWVSLEAAGASGFFVRPLRVAEGFAGAMAVGKAERRVRCFAVETLRRFRPGV